MNIIRKLLDKKPDDTRCDEVDIRVVESRNGDSDNRRHVSKELLSHVVVILASRESDIDINSILHKYSKCKIVLIAEEESPRWGLRNNPIIFHQAITFGQINWIIRLVGPIDFLLDFRNVKEVNETSNWKTLLFHLRDEGIYSRFFLNSAACKSSSLLDEVVGEYRRPVKTGDPNPSTALVGSFEVSGNRIEIHKSGDHYVKHRHSEASRFLSSRSNDLEVVELARVTGTNFNSRARVINHASAVKVGNFDQNLRVPDLQLRKYVGKIGIISNSLVVSDLDILPDSFKFPVGKTLNNINLKNITSDFAEMPVKFLPKTHLPGSYYHIDSTNSGHFGHLMGEVLACLWGWDEAKSSDPELKIIFRIRYPNERIPRIELALFQAFGIRKEDIVWIDKPVWVDSLVAAAPMWQNQIPHFVHPDIQKIWNRISDSIVDHSITSHDKVFISRASNLNDRSCRNIHAVEKYFSDHGFSILYPENLPLGEQAAIFRNATVIAGFGGSGLFNIIHSRNLTNLIVLNQEAYTARNEHLFSSVIGCQVDYFWSTPDQAHPTGGWSQEAYVSAWEFDFDRNLSQMDKLMTDINIERENV